jgi:hypothetical protein
MLDIDATAVLEEEVGTEEDNGDHGAPLRCAACLNAITRPVLRISVHGAHRHEKTNPAGLIFDIGCFTAAPGCAETGQPTPEWSWFPGFEWRFAECARCGAHIGWSYRDRAGNRFFGLILARLREG